MCILVSTEYFMQILQLFMTTKVFYAKFWVYEYIVLVSYGDPGAKKWEFAEMQNSAVGEKFSILSYAAEIWGATIAFIFQLWSYFENSKDQHHSPVSNTFQIKRV